MDDNDIASSSGKNTTTPSFTIKQPKNENNKRDNQGHRPSYKSHRPIKNHQAQHDSGDANDLQRLIQFQDTLDYLQDEWAVIDIVLQSLKTAFTIHPSRMATEDYLHNIDNELSMAVDDLMAQIRNLDRSLKKLEFGMNLF